MPQVMRRDRTPRPGAGPPTPTTGSAWVAEVDRPPSGRLPPSTGTTASPFSPGLTSRPAPPRKALPRERGRLTTASRRYGASPPRRPRPRPPTHLIPGSSERRCGPPPPPPPPRGRAPRVPAPPAAKSRTLRDAEVANAIFRPAIARPAPVPSRRNLDVAPRRTAPSPRKATTARSRRPPVFQKVADTSCSVDPNASRGTDTSCDVDRNDLLRLDARAAWSQSVLIAPAHRVGWIRDSEALSQTSCEVDLGVRIHAARRDEWIQTVLDASARRDVDIFGAWIHSARWIRRLSEGSERRDTA